MSGEIKGSIKTAGKLIGTLKTAGKLIGTLKIRSAPEVTAYSGPYEVTPHAWDAQELLTDGKLMTDDVTIFKVPYYETSNIFDGLTVFIAEDTNG